MDQETFTDHSVWSLVDQIEGTLLDVTSNAPDDTELGVGKLRYLVGYVRSHRTADAGPYSPAMLAGAQTHLQGVHTSLTNYMSGWNANYLHQAATDHGDSVLTVLGTWPTLPAKGGAAAAALRHFEEYRKLAEASIEALRQQLRDLADEQRKHEQTTLTTEQELAARLAALQQRVEQQDSRIGTDEARLDTALTTTNQAFTDGQTKREERFSDWLSKKGGELTESAQPYLDQLQQVTSDGDQVYRALEELRDSTERVAGQATAAVLARNHGAYALREWIAGIVANVLGFIALGAGALIITSAVAGIGANEAVSWQFVALKLGLTGTIVAAAAVAIRLGRQFLSRAAAAKRVELELRAIGPFLADIDEEPSEVQKAKLAFLGKTFGQSWDDPHQAKTDEDLVNITAVERIADSLAKVITRGQS